MTTNRIEEMLEDDSAGFTPTVVDDTQAQVAWEKHTNAAPAAEEPEAPVARATPEAPSAAKPQVAESDAALLRASGWSQEDIQALSPEAAARHALREGGRGSQKPKADAERAEEPDSDLEALLTEEFSAKTAKKLAPFLSKLTKNQAALSRDVREQTLDGLRERYQGQYPELARPEVQRALLAVVGETPSRDQYERGLRVLYGTRQTPAERSEAREQVSGQVGFGSRGPSQAKDPEAADRAAWNHYRKTGNVEEAQRLRGRLNTR